MFHQKTSVETIKLKNNTGKQGFYDENTLLTLTTSARKNICVDVTQGNVNRKRFEPFEMYRKVLQLLRIERMSNVENTRADGK